MWNFRISRRRVWRRLSSECRAEYSDRSLPTHHPYDGGSKNLWNVGKLVPDYTAHHPRRQSSSAVMLQKTLHGSLTQSVSPSRGSSCVIGRYPDRIPAGDMYLFICGLFNDPVSNSDCKTSNGTTIMNWKGCGKKRLWPNLKCYSSTCQEWLRKTMKSLSQDNRSPGRDLNHRPPEYETGVLTTWSWRSLKLYQLQCVYGVDWYIVLWLSVIIPEEYVWNWP
jgi:hypothetical protein